jgi:hypothetical protein
VGVGLAAHLASPPASRHSFVGTPHRPTRCSFRLTAASPRLAKRGTAALYAAPRRERPHKASRPDDRLQPYVDQGVERILRGEPSAAGRRTSRRRAEALADLAAAIAQGPVRRVHRQLTPRRPARLAPGPSVAWSPDTCPNNASNSSPLSPTDVTARRAAVRGSRLPQKRPTPATRATPLPRPPRAHGWPAAAARVPTTAAAAPPPRRGSLGGRSVVAHSSRRRVLPGGAGSQTRMSPGGYVRSGYGSCPGVAAAQRLELAVVAARAQPQVLRRADGELAGAKDVHSTP